MNATKWGIYIGRFQPFHNGHLKQIKAAFYEAGCQRLLILIGTKLELNRTLRNPFVYSECREMIINNFKPEEVFKIRVDVVFDQSSDSLWAYEVNEKIYKYVGEYDPIVLMGDYSDPEATYLKYLSEYIYMHKWGQPTNPEGLHAKDIRAILFGTNGGWQDYGIAPTPRWEKIQHLVPKSTLRFLEKFAQTDEYAMLRKEYESHTAH